LSSSGNLETLKKQISEEPETKWKKEAWFVYKDSVAHMNEHTARMLGWLIKTMTNEFTLNTVQQYGGYK
jgi:hypothetical protein